MFGGISILIVVKYIIKKIIIVKEYKRDKYNDRWIKYDEELYKPYQTGLHIINT